MLFSSFLVFAKITYLSQSGDGFSIFILLMPFPVLKSHFLGGVGIAVFAKMRTGFVFTFEAMEEPVGIKSQNVGASF